ncbi:MAG: carbohydrate ABC transporter permease [Anaerolineales bacterium]|nr:carbohydrate ABC transporter permease [Anaerolineales bacterium]
MSKSERPRRGRDASTLTLRIWMFTGMAVVNLFVWLAVLLYLFPLSYMVVTSFKTSAQLSERNSPILPAVPVTYEYEGRNLSVYFIPAKIALDPDLAPGMPDPQTKTRQWALVDIEGGTIHFVDPQNPDAGLLSWEGSRRDLDRVFHPHWEWRNFVNLWERIEYPRLLRNTLILVVVGEIGVLASSIAVAYGFSRFRIPGGKFLFLLLIATIMIPDSITLVPTFFLYAKVMNVLKGMTSWPGIYFFPLLFQHFFGSAVYIFLLRQNFKAIPRDLDEAAMIDGAGPMRTLVSIVLPQAIPTVVTVALLHFFNAWNEMRMASLYLGVSRERTIAFSAQAFQSYGFTPEFLQASAVMLMIVPIVVLFLAQRFFMQDMVITGMEK